MSRRQQQELSNHSVTERPDKLGLCSKRTESLKNIQQTAVSEQPDQATKTIQSPWEEGLRTGGADQSTLSYFLGHVTNFLIQVSQRLEKNQDLPINKHTDFSLLTTLKKKKSFFYNYISN